ncbi:hypothetical protein F4810DRAFT_721738 [Camillea tinctor]|nr:hypothetical protein F4810DRAFT_721738 [Camillea tinctor]
MPLRSPRVNANDEAEPAHKALGRRIKWKRGMKAGPGQAIEELHLDESKAWRRWQDSATDPVIIWLQKPEWAGSHNSSTYVTANLAAHERILTAQARLMGAKVVWVRKEMHSTSPRPIFQNGRFGSIDAPVPPRILVYLGLQARRVHWQGWWTCVPKRDQLWHRPTDTPLRVGSQWDPKVPQAEFWLLGPPCEGYEKARSALEPGVPRWEGYVPEPFRGTHLEPALRIDFKPVGARERYILPRRYRRSRGRRYGGI